MSYKQWQIIVNRKPCYHLSTSCNCMQALKISTCSPYITSECFVYVGKLSIKQLNKNNLICVHVHEYLCFLDCMSKYVGYISYRLHISNLGLFQNLGVVRKSAWKPKFKLAFC